MKILKNPQCRKLSKRSTLWASKTEIFLTKNIKTHRKKLHSAEKARKGHFGLKAFQASKVIISSITCMLVSSVNK